MKKKISIVYFTGAGNTEKLAEAVRDGAASHPDSEVNLVKLSGLDIKEGRWSNNDVLERLDASDAIIFGTPTYMGSVSAQMKTLMDASSERYIAQKWKDKIGAAFSVSGGPSGDKFNTLMTLATFAMQHGMLWVGLGLTGVEQDGTNSLGFYFGAGAQALMESPEEKPNAPDIQTGVKLGARVADITSRFS